MQLPQRLMLLEDFAFRGTYVTPAKGFRPRVGEVIVDSNTPIHLNLDWDIPQYLLVGSTGIQLVSHGRRTCKCSLSNILEIVNGILGNGEQRW